MPSRAAMTETEKELLTALKQAASHMLCGEYDNRAAFIRDRDQVFDVLKRYENKESLDA